MLHDPLQVRQHLIVPDPDDPIAQSFQIGSPRRVRRVIRMLPAVDLHDQPQRWRAEIRNVSSADHMLPSEPNAQHVAAKRAPQMLFCIRHVPPQILRAFGQTAVADPIPHSGCVV
jgi:hypothetical protein